jgi:hypothetical protein
VIWAFVHLQNHRTGLNAASPLKASWLYRIFKNHPVCSHQPFKWPCGKPGLTQDNTARASGSIKFYYLVGFLFFLFFFSTGRQEILLPWCSDRISDNQSCDDEKF